MFGLQICCSRAPERHLFFFQSSVETVPPVKKMDIPGHSARPRRRRRVPKRKTIWLRSPVSADRPSICLRHCLCHLCFLNFFLLFPFFGPFSRIFFCFLQPPDSASSEQKQLYGLALATTQAEPDSSERHGAVAHGGSEGSCWGLEIISSSVSDSPHRTEGRWCVSSIAVSFFSPVSPASGHVSKALQRQHTSFTQPR